MTAHTIAPAPVRKTLRVNVNAARAFDVFTARMSQWWPATHSTLKSPFKESIIEPMVKGRWYHVGEDGSEADTGHVLAWEPPHRLLLAWQLNPDWQFDPELITEVEVKFIAEGERVTRVEFEHRHLERMGARAQETRDRVDGTMGWPAILELYRQAADGK